MDYMKQAVESMHICGDGDFTKKCSRWIEEQTGTGKCLLTTSCTHALEMAALLSVESPADREILYNMIMDKNLSVRQAEEQASNLNRGIRAVSKTVPEKSSKSAMKSPEILQLEEKFLSATGCRVEIKGKYKNGIMKKGKILIPFSSEEELERIFQIVAPGEDLYE